MKVRQHVPSHSEAEPEETDVKSLKELLALPWISRWTSVKGVTQFSVQADGKRYLLLADCPAHFYYVAAYLYPDLTERHILDKLPKFKLTYTPRSL